jgi:8-oxo-dGTP pyrophosphatase MutT (NUDIX family)
LTAVRLGGSASNSKDDRGIFKAEREDMAEELLDIIDKEDRIAGQAAKSLVHDKGLKHRVGAVLLQRQDGKYLIPTASGLKAEAGRLYHSAAGHVLSGESYPECAKRELFEETGLEAEVFEYLGSFWFEKDYPARKERERFEVYKAAYDDSMGRVRLNEEQVNERWLTLEQLKSIYRTRGEAVSLPLQMTCRFILRLDEGKSETWEEQACK